jgi:hypothetical protein
MQINSESTFLKHILLALILAIVATLIGCRDNGYNAKGFQVSPTVEDVEQKTDNGLKGDSLKFATQPSEVLLTGLPNVRLTTIYKVNVNKRDGQTFIGSNNFHYAYNDIGDFEINDWNYHLIPGMEAVYGYNLVNVAHFSFEDQQQHNLFDESVLIHTLYYPSFQLDSLAGETVLRDYFKVSVTITFGAVAAMLNSVFWGAPTCQIEVVSSPKSMQIACTVGVNGGT